MVSEEFRVKNTAVLKLLDNERKRNTESIWIVTTKDHYYPVKIHDIGINNSEGECECYFNDILKVLEEDNCKSFFFIHNHPTEDSYPSLPDIQLTYNLIDYAKEHNLRFIDHFIISGFDSFSFQEANVCFDMWKVKNGVKFNFIEPNKSMPSNKSIKSYEIKKKNIKKLILKKKIMEELY